MTVTDLDKFSVPEGAREEHRKICELFNSELDSRELFKAAFTFYQLSLEEKIARTGEAVVQDGLFKGLRLYPKSLSSQLMPKIFGTYEAEVQDLLARKSQGINGFIDIGCAEGFYVAGMAAKYRIKSTGVDIDPRAISAIDYVSRANSLQDLVTFEEAISAAVRNHEGRIVILVDVDGGEEVVIKEVSELVSTQVSIQHATLIVESDHDRQSGRINTSRLIRLLDSLGWDVIEVAPQQPHLRFNRNNRDLSFLDQVALGAEGRPGGQAWICAER